MENKIIDINNNESSGLKSKWLNIKSLLMNKSILENSINEIKDKKLSQLFSKFSEIYKEKIMIRLLAENNKNLISDMKKDGKSVKINNKKNDIIITKNLKELYSGSGDDIIKFFFYFRENYSAMVRFIKFIPTDKKQTLAEFLCHFFYDNYLTQSKEEEEIIKLINLLLEEEVDELLSPLCRNFLHDSFLAFLLSELGNTYEIGNYIDITLNCLIKDIEDKNSFGCYLNIIYNSKKHYNYNREENKFFEMDKQRDDFFDYLDSKRGSKLGYFLFNGDLRHSARINLNLNLNAHKYYSSNLEKNFEHKKSDLNISSGFRAKDIKDLIKKDFQIKNYINKNFFLNINEYYFRSLLSSEKDEIMKSFYIRQIKILNSSQNKNIFSCHDYFKKMKNGKIISKLAIKQFNNMVETINNFINKLLNNLEKKEIIPYNIKIICKLIDIYISKKFKNISKIQKNSLICNFLFRLLIFPILENPDLSFSFGDMIISLNTRSILHHIYMVLSHLIEGELFNANNSTYYTIFNRYIIENYKRINKIIDNIIKISIPKSYNNINEKNLKELDFTQCKSICFNSHEFSLFHNTIHSHKDEIFKGDKYIVNIFNNISEKRKTIQSNVDNYYLITNENYDNYSIRIENKIGLNNNPKNENGLYKKIKYAIIYVLENLQLSIILEKNINTQKTFEIINQYLNFYIKPVYKSKKPPLSWYSQYIVNNINLLSKEYKENDFQLLYNDIELNLKNTLDEYKNLNDYLTINLVLKSNLLNKTLKIYKNKTEKIRKTEMNIKSLIFIETNEIKICLMRGNEYNNLMRSEKKSVNNNLLILSHPSSCPHNNLDLSIEKKKFLEKKYHSNTVKEFAQKFSGYHKVLSEEIMNFSFYKDFYRSKSFLESNNINDDNDIKLNDKGTFSSASIKEILETYINTIKKVIENNNLIFPDYNEYSDNEKKEIIKFIWNYILKSICDPISSKKPPTLDNLFKIRCVTLQKIVKPENLDIPKEIVVKDYIRKLGEKLKIIDDLRSPNEIFKQFDIFIGLINSLYKFFLNIGIVETDELLSIIIYCILIFTPERIIFKTNFCKFFLREEELIGNIGISITQIESALIFINKLGPNQIGFSQEEFNEICSKVKFIDSK